jgi:hypothetical protein
VTTPIQFKQDITDSGGVVAKSTGGPDALDNWNTETLLNPPKKYNTQGRLDLYKTNGNNTYRDPAYAAAGLICGYTNPTGLCSAGSSSIADGVYSYDKTTGPNLCTRNPTTGNPDPNPDYWVRTGLGLPAGLIPWTFCAKPGPPYNDNVSNTISYPFPLPKPKAKNLKSPAINQETNHFKDPTINQSFYKHYWDVVEQGGPPQWNRLFPACPPDPVTGAAQKCYDRVVFVDAHNSTLDFSTGGTRQGVLVVWCGRLVQQSKFQGIILSLIGDGSGFQASSCAATDGGFPGTYRNYGNPGDLNRNNALSFQGWLYADGGTPSKAGIELGPNSSVGFLPGGDWNLLNEVLEFQDGPPTTFKLQSWRELYQDAP